MSKKMHSKRDAMAVSWKSFPSPYDLPGWKGFNVLDPSGPGIDRNSYSAFFLILF